MLRCGKHANGSKVIVILGNYPRKTTNMNRIKIKLKLLITSKEFLTLILALFVSIAAYTLITLLIKL